ncbi:MAG: ELM1/GtrOC1 family putative glycosyltransferase, partial [Candidatus Omnitrophota bacterium]
MIDYIASILVRALNILFRIVPIGASLWLGRRIGSLVFMVNKKRRLIAYANLKAAFGKEKSPRELRSITKRVYQNMVQTFVEILNLTKVSKEYVDKYVEVVNLERVRNAANDPRGVILLTGHFGNWELSNLVGAVKGFKMAVLAREQKMKRLNELLNRLRESKGCTVIRKGISIRELIKALRAKNIVGILSDQDAGKNGVFVNFFGRPASTPPGAMEFAKRTDSIVLPNFIARIQGPYHKVYIEEPIDCANDQSGDVAASLQKYVSLLERYVREYPDQWLWLHKRWKSTPQRTILVLNDGKQGHLNQALAVAHQIRRARTTQGYSMDDTKVVVEDVRYRSKFRHAVLTAASAFATWRSHGRMGYMAYCLTKESYESLMAAYGEFVVSCGASLAPVNVFMARECNAKNVVVMSPGPIGTDKFSLAIIPRHDRPRKRKNVVVTEAAPHLMDRASLARYGSALMDRLKIAGAGPKIGLLIGGDSENFTMTEATISLVVKGVLEAAEKLNGQI